MQVNPSLPLTTEKLAVRSVEGQVLSTTVTGNGGWIDVSGLVCWTLFVAGLEVGGTVKVEVANGAAGPTNGVVLSTLSPDANGGAQFAVRDSYHWVRVSKVQGGTPTATTGTLYGNFA